MPTVALPPIPNYIKRQDMTSVNLNPFNETLTDLFDNFVYGFELDIISNIKPIMET